MPMDAGQRFRIETAMFLAAGIAFCAAATHWQWFQTLDLALYDSAMGAHPAPLGDDILIVGIDEQSMAEYGAWPWPRDLQAQLLLAINAGSPSAMLVDFVYGGDTDPAADQALVEAALAVDTLALPVMIDALATNRQLIEVLPFPALLHAADVLGHVHVELDGDAIARGVYLYQGITDAYWPHLALALAERLARPVDTDDPCVRSADFSLQNHRCGFVLTSFVGPPGSIPEVSAVDLLSGRVPATALRGKTVFVGITTSAAPDSITSPVSVGDRPMSGVEFNANLYNSLVTGRTVKLASTGWLLCIALACVVPPVLVLPHLRPTLMLSAAIGMACVPVLVNVVLLAALKLQLPLAAAFVTCLLAYPYWSWRRNEVAWQFVDAEISRLGEEKTRWARTPEGRSVEAIVEVMRRQLDAEAVWYEASPSIEHDRQITMAGEHGRWLVLSRSIPFTASERAFARKLGPLIRTVEPASSVPGERLAAQIRRLQTAAMEVRLGREVGLRGLEEMPNGVAVLSLLNQVLLINHACRSLLDLPHRSDNMLLDDLVRGLVPPLGRSWREISRTVVLEQETVTFETQTPSAVPVVVKVAPLGDPGVVPEFWAITLTNLADVRLAERDREEALAFLSHDLRSPMLSVLALVRGSEPTPALQEIEGYAQKALAVSEQFLQLSRVQAREAFEVYELDLAVVLENAADQLFRTAREKNISLRVNTEVAEETGAWLTGNGELLERAFVNLLTNAIKFSDADSQVTVELTVQPGAFLVDVTDRGIGIPANEIDHVFDPYFRSNYVRLAEQRGAGLGLRFVKTVIERHGGSIRVSSRLEEGSRFTVSLPREKRHEVSD